MSLKIAINGLGRIGRTFLRTIFESTQAQHHLEIVAINLGPQKIADLGLLLKYDTFMGQFPAHISYHHDLLTIGSHAIKILHEADPAQLPWKQHGIDWVVEASGRFCSHAGATKHQKAGAQRVLITAPCSDADVLIIPGINDDDYQPSKHTIVSLGSCTTNCFAPIIKVLHEAFTIESGMMTTIHAYTNDQVLLDLGHEDPRRARAAATNIIPTDTGVNKTIVNLFPELAGKLAATAIRVPVPLGSLIDFRFTSKTALTTKIINQAFHAAATGSLRTILQYSDEPLVSSDFIGNQASAIFDSILTKAIENTGQVFAWYDNEAGYSARLKDFLVHSSS